MTAPLSTASPRPLTRMRPRARWRHQVLAVGCLVIGGGLLSYTLGWWPMPWRSTLEVVFGAGLVLAGLVVLIGGETLLEQPSPTFSVEEGQTRVGVAQLRAGWHDIQMNAFAGNTQLFVAELPTLAHPLVHSDETHTTTITVTDQHMAPLMQSRWRVALSKSQPWILHLASTLGDLTLNLREVTLWAIHVQSWAGQVEIILPATGHGEGELRLTLGTAHVQVPEGAALRLKLQPGWLATAHIDEQRFPAVGPNEWETPGFATAPHRFTLTVQLGTGELQVH